MLTMCLAPFFPPRPGCCFSLQPAPGSGCRCFPLAGVGHSWSSTTVLEISVVLGSLEGSLPGSLTGTSAGETDCHTFAPSSYHFKLCWWKGWGLFFPLWTTLCVNNLGFSPGALWRKEPAFQYHSLTFLSILTKRGYSRNISLNRFFPEKVSIASRLSRIGFLPLVCRTAYYLSHFSNFSCFSEYIVQGQKELKNGEESIYKSLFNLFYTLFFLERSSSCQTLSYRFVEPVMMTPDLGRAQLSG